MANRRALINEVMRSQLPRLPLRFTPFCSALLTTPSTPAQMDHDFRESKFLIPMDGCLYILLLAYCAICYGPK